jgi:putative hemolysin
MSFTGGTGVGVLLAVLAVAWLTAAAIAVRAVSRIWLRHWVEHRPAGFAVAERYLERPTRLVIAASAGCALATIAAGAAVTAHGTATSRAARDLLIAAVVLVIFGNLLPRAIARRWPARLLPVLVPPLRAVELLLAPIVAASRRIERLLELGRIRAHGGRSAREGLEDLLREGELEGVGGRQELEIITGVVSFGEKKLRDVMTPRSGIYALDESLLPPELARRVAESEYSRVPITRGESLDQIVGMVHAFDVLRADGERPPLREIGRAAADRPCNDQLFRMLRASTHLAVVHDAEGMTLGIVTLEDLLEELVGDIRDEHDELQPPQRARAS